MATSKEERILLDCPICFENFNDPKYLPCLHTFCELCIESFIDSSILDCNVNHREKSFNCPVCRLVNRAPYQSISAKEWAKQLPKNHQILAIKDLYEKSNNTESEVLCDYCPQSSEQVIATHRCKSCRVNLCEICCKRIHKKVRSYAVHTIVDLRSANAEMDTTTDLGNCVVHTNRLIEVYCFDHEELGCSFCLATKHMNCKTVLSLDEVAENDLENQSKSFIRETKQIRDLTTSAIQNTEKNITKLTQKKNKILQNIDKKIEEIKERLDSLKFGLERSLRIDHEGQISKLSSILQTLDDFDSTLAQSESIASTTMQSGSRKQVLIAMEKIKMQISEHLRSMGTKRKQLKASTVTCIWSFNEAIDSLQKLRKLGDFEYVVEEFDFVTPLEKHYKIIEEEVNPNTIGILLLYLLQNCD